jgi:UDP-N-acetylglucosamine--N-acetylmuramyl-(pentapeptide) pyrophosphoryl-undecaprenol N-acetylglucosamine transferase
MAKKIFVTGGHYTPARAVIDELLKNKNYEIFYLGRKYAMEDDDALALEYLELSNLSNLKYLELTTGRLQRKFWVNPRQSVKALLKVFTGLIQSFYYLGKFRPNLVMSFGGYLAVPVVIGAWLLGIPVLTHEQTPVRGLANRIIAPFAKKILTGNPLRREILALKFRPQHSRTILVTGGNQGSHVINQAVKTLIKKYPLIIQTGDSRYNDFEELSKLNKNTYKFLTASQMAKALDRAGLVISRAGANICTELAYLGKPAILIPIPWSSGNEQKLNAQWLKEAGIAEILEEKDLNGQTLLSLTKKMFKDLKKYQHPVPLPLDAAGRIVKEIEAYA